jgi:competence protein ComEC
MKHILLLSSFILLYFTTYSETIQIHHIGVGQGDATLIIVTNNSGKKATILIDAGNSSGKGAAVAQAIEVDMVTETTKRLDLIITSHLHSDHLGGMQKVMTDLLANGWQLGVVIDRAATYISSSEVDCYAGNSTDTYAANDPTGPLPTSTLVATYKKYISSLLAAGSITAWGNVMNGYNLMTLIPGFTCSTTMLSLCGNAVVCSKSDASGNCIEMQNYSSYVGNENDYSYSFLLQLGTFKYFTGGDMGGESPYVDLETPLLSYFQSRPDATTFHFCCYKASHHGSEHSTNTAFVAYTKPTVTAVPSALRSFSGTQLPGQNTLNRIQSSSTNSNIFYTYVYNTNPYSGTVANYKDVVFTVDGSSFETDHRIKVTTFQRDKTALSFIFGTSTDTTIVCNKH